MKKRGIFKSLVAVTALGLALILGFSSCSRDAAQEAEVCFTIPQEVFNQIAQAARAASDIKVNEGTGSDMEIVSVPDENNLTFTISLYDSSNKLIDTQAQSKTFAKWLEASANNDISFTFSNITVGKTVYATASATAVIDGTTKEICSSQSNPILITQGSNVIPLELTFTVVNEKEPEEPEEPEEPAETNDKITLNITINNSKPSDITNQKLGAVSLYCVDAEYADEHNFFTKKSDSDTFDISTQNLMTLVDNAGYLVESSSGSYILFDESYTRFCTPLPAFYSARDDNIKDEGNGKITVQYSTKPYGNITQNKSVYIMAVVTYSSPDATVLPEENHNYVKTQLSSYWRGIAKLESISQTESNKIELSINQTEIPCRVLIMYGPLDENLQIKGYTTVSVEDANKMVTDNYKTIDETDLKSIFPDFDFSTYVYNGVAATPSSPDGINYGSCAYIHAQGRLEGMSFDAGGGIGTTEPVTDILNITATPSEKFYLNTGSISLSATKTFTEEDLTSSSDIIWNAKLLYGGVDINDFGTEYYKLFKDGNNKWSVQLANNLAAAGTYQLYVTATYKGVTSSQITNIDVNNSYLYEYNFDAPDNDEFNTILDDFKDTVGKLSAPGYFIFTGSLNSDPDTADEQFEDIVSSLKWLYPEYCYSLDMSDFSGGTKLSQDCNISSSKLASIDLPNTITTLELKAFNECSLLKSITIPGTIETIEGGTFYKCSSLEEIKFTSENSTYYNDSTGNLCKIDGTDKILLYPSATFLKNPNFASTGITKIGGYAFYYAELSGPLNLTGIVSFEQNSFQYAKIPSITSFGNITEIPANAFERSEISGTVNLTGITSIGEKAFYYSKLPGALDLTGINSLGEYAFAETKITSITSYGNVTELPAYVFYNSKLSGELDLTGFTSIGNYAFAKTGITSITSFGTFTETPEGAFKECESLTTINLENVTTIGESSFYGCSSLSTLENSENLTTIGGAGFRGCNFAKFTITNNLTLGSSALVSAVEELTIDIAITAENASSIITNYIKNISGVKHVIFAQSAVIPNEGSSFKLRQSDQNPTPNLPASTIALNGAFLYYFRRTLESIEFKGANSSIGGTQFINYTQLKQVITNGNVTSIGDFTFYGCTSLASIDLEGVTCVGTCAFENCTALSEITIGNTIKQIGQRAFYNATGLSNTTISIPVSVFAIGNSAFYTSEQTQPVITIAHIEAGEGIETWYNFSTNSSTTYTYWTTTIMDPSTGACPDNVSSNGATTITGSDQDTIDNTIISAVTTSSGSISYLRKIEN